MKKCNDHGMLNVGITDHGNLTGMWECFKYAQKYNINLIPGNEFYVVPDVEKCRTGDWTRGSSYHLCLLAMDNKGWENLLLLTAKSNLIGFYYEPRIDFAMLREHSEGLWALSGCLGGFLYKNIKQGRGAATAADMLYDIFGDRFSLEIQVNSIPEQKILNQACIDIHKDTGIPLVGTIDAHYLDKQDSHKQDLLFAMQLGKTLDDESRLKMPEEEHSVEVPDEVYSRFRQAYKDYGILSCQRTIEIAENSRVDFTVESKDYKIPNFDIVAQDDWSEFMKWRSGCECHMIENKCLVHGSNCEH